MRLSLCVCFCFAPVGSHLTCYFITLTGDASVGGGRHLLTSGMSVGSLTHPTISLTVTLEKI